MSLDLIENKTKIFHREKGEGLFIEYTKSGYLKIKFKDEVLIFVEDGLNKGLISLTPFDDEKKKQHIEVDDKVLKKEPLKKKKSEILQLDSSRTIIGEMNVFEADSSKDTIYFNETYTVIGKELIANEIRASYDLIVLGDINVKSISVNGNLFVKGNIVSKKLSCESSINCEGNITSDAIYAGNDIVASSISCSDIVCEGNLILKTVLDTSDLCRVGKTIVACEGVIGEGVFSSESTIANEYFDFNGDIVGKVLELYSGDEFGRVNSNDETGIKDLILDLEAKIKMKTFECPKYEEEEIADFVETLSNNYLSKCKAFEFLFKNLVRISYLSKIEDFYDYLLVVAAKNILPKELYLYESLEHINSVFLPNAISEIDDIVFSSKDISKFYVALIIIDKFELDISKEEAYEKVFNTIGLKYNTVVSTFKEV